MKIFNDHVYRRRLWMRYLYNLFSNEYIQLKFIHYAVKIDNLFNGYTQQGTEDILFFLTLLFKNWEE